MFHDKIHRKQINFSQYSLDTKICWSEKKNNSNIQYSKSLLQYQTKVIKSQPVSEVDLVLKYWDCKSETEFQLLTRQLVILAVSIIALAGESPYFPISFVFKGSIPFKKSLIQTCFVSSSHVTPGINRFLQTAVNIQVRRFLMKLFGL